MNIRPLKCRVLVQQDPRVEKIGSLFLPDIVEERPAFGTVLAIGPGEQRGEAWYTPDVRVGARVYFKRRADTALNTDPREGDGFEDMLMLDETDIIAEIYE